MLNPTVRLQIKSIIILSYLIISVGPCVISFQMFVKSEFPLDSALVCDSD